MFSCDYVWLVLCLGFLLIRLECNLVRGEMVWFDIDILWFGLRRLLMICVVCVRIFMFILNWVLRSDVLLCWLLNVCVVGVMKCMKGLVVLVWLVFFVRVMVCGGLVCGWIWMCC